MWFSIVTLIAGVTVYVPSGNASDHPPQTTTRTITGISSSGEVNLLIEATGSLQTTTGTLKGKTVNLTTTKLGNQVLTTGTIGSESVILTTDSYPLVELIVTPE